eukprot:TRINITY_DN11841_c0_g1_i1.p1 TRINITY_DN11841_c0_g1~~TRINITY_DN11841_c0_g1_i1.p1  ORF type:complete len:127 (-),score=35.54 TRINITY_DN11841_c0_g1_i1:218-574(-)
MGALAFSFTLIRRGPQQFFFISDMLVRSKLVTNVFEQQRNVSTILQQKSLWTQQRSECTVFNGSLLAKEINTEVKNEIIKLRSEHESFKPKLVAIAVGNNPASQIYLARKEEAAGFCG